MTVEPWHYDTAEDLDKTLVQRLRGFPREPDLLVYSARLVVATSLRGWLRVYHRLQIRGRENLPREGSFVLVANHCSHLDALTILSAMPIRKLHRVFPAAAQDFFFVSVPRLAVAAVVVNALPFDRQAKSARACRFAGNCWKSGQRAAAVSRGDAEHQRRAGRVQGRHRPDAGRDRRAGDSLLPRRHVSAPGRREAISAAAASAAGDRRPRSYQHLGRGKESALAISRDLREAILAWPPRPPRQALPRCGLDSGKDTRHESIASRACHPGRRFTASEHTMTLPDGVELFYRAWLPATPTEKSLVIFHRGHEHSGRVQDIVEALDLADVAVFAWDARGHGRTPGERGYAPRFATLVKDVDCFVRHLAETFGKRPENMVVLAQSVGAVTVAAWVHDYAPRIRAMVLAAPALAIKLYVPAAIPGLRLLLRMRPGRKTFIKSYVKATMLTHDPEQARRYDEDSLIAREIAANVLVDLHDTAARLIDDAAAIRVPTLLLAAGADWVVKLGPQRKLFDRLGTPIKRMKVFPGMYHDLLHERDRRQVIDEARQFIVEAFAREAVPPPLLDADRYGFTRNEYDRLSEPLPWCSPRGLGFRLQRLGAQTVGRLSRGVRLGWQTGFDSGRTLDYVYENQPQGALVLGKWIDRAYLNSIGWRGIRQRRTNLEKLLREAIGRVRAAGHPVRVLDIAAGPGRYILETLRDLAGDDLSALLRDNVEANLEAGRKLAAAAGLDNVTFQRGDAFDENVAGRGPALAQRRRGLRAL